MMEMFKFYQVATGSQKAKMRDLISAKKINDAWKFLEEVTGTKLHR